MVEPARNVFHQRLDLIRQGQGGVVETVSRLETALFQVASGVGEVRTSLESGQKDLASSLGALREEIVNSRADPQWQQDIATILDRVSRSVPAWGSGAALLCVSVDVDGTFSQASVLGRMVAKTVAVDGVEPKNVGLEHVVSLDREDYAHAAAKIAEAEGFDLTAEDFRNFHMLIAACRPLRRPRRGLDVEDFADIRSEDVGRQACLVVGTIQTFRAADAAGRKVHARNEELESHFGCMRPLETMEQRAPDEEKEFGKGVRFSFANLLHHHPLRRVEAGEGERPGAGFIEAAGHRPGTSAATCGGRLCGVLRLPPSWR